MRTSHEEIADQFLSLPGVNRAALAGRWMELANGVHIRPDRAAVVMWMQGDSKSLYITAWDRIIQTDQFLITYKKNLGILSGSQIRVLTEMATMVGYNRMLLMQRHGVELPYFMWDAAKPDV